MSEERSIIPHPDPENRDSFAEFLLSLSDDLEALAIPSVLTEEAVLPITSTEYPDDRQCFRIQKTSFNQELRNAVENIFISVYAVHQNKTQIRTINGIMIPRVTFTAEMRIQIVPTRGNRMRTKISMEVGDIFPLALFTGLPVEARQVPLFKIQSIGHDQVRLMPVFNLATTLPDS